MTVKVSKRLPVFVSSAHIYAGIYWNSSRCPIAQALYDQGFHEVYVENFTVTLDGESWNLSERAQRFIKRFDKGEKVLASKFVLWQ